MDKPTKAEPRSPMTDIGGRPARAVSEMKANQGRDGTGAPKDRRRARGSKSMRAVKYEQRKIRGEITAWWTRTVAVWIGGGRGVSEAKT